MKASNALQTRHSLEVFHAKLKTMRKVSYTLLHCWHCNKQQTICTATNDSMCQTRLRVEGDEESLITHSLHTMRKCTDAVKAEKTLLPSIKLKPSCRESSKLLIKPDGAYQASSQLNLKITKSLLFDSSKFTLSTIHTYSPQHNPLSLLGWSSPLRDVQYSGRTLLLPRRTLQ